MRKCLPAKKSHLVGYGEEILPHHHPSPHTHQMMQILHSRMPALTKNNSVAQFEGSYHQTEIVKLAPKHLVCANS